MLESVKISRRQSEIRQALAELVGKPELTEDETRSMEALDKEYRLNEVKYRSALIAEDAERREAKDDLENGERREWDDLIGRFELRQVALFLDEGRQIDGPTAEVVQEMRSRGGYRGVPVPLAALELRAGETVASGTPAPVSTRPIIDRLFPQSVAAQMGAQLINIDSGVADYPVTTSSVTAGWADGETASVAGPTTYTTTDKTLSPDQNLGITMKVTRKALKQSGAALEQAIRRDMNSTIAAELDKALFLGTGANGQPLGLITGSSSDGSTGHNIVSKAVDAAADWAAFRTAVVAFMTANAASGPGSVRALIRPELWAWLDSVLIEGTAVSEFDRLMKHMPNIVQTANALAAPTGSPTACSAVLTTSAGGVAPAFLGVWGGVDLIRDPYSDAASGGLRLTALMTADVAVARPAQVRVLTGLQVEASE